MIIWDVINKSANLTLNSHKGCLRMWMPPRGIKLPIGGPGVEGGDVQLPVQGHQGDHDLPPSGSCLGPPVLPVPLSPN